jgi:hypothetical protein
MSKPSTSKGASKPPATKKPKLEPSDDEDSSASLVTDSGFLANIHLKRKKCADNILEFKFNKKRCRLLSKSMELGDSGGGILYWMSREQRVQGSF